LKQNDPKYKDMCIQYYFKENAKLGEAGKQHAPEKTFEEILKEGNYQDKYLQSQDKRGMNPCFFLCSGKYSYFKNMTEDINKDIFHQGRYIKYLKFLLN